MEALFSGVRPSNALCGDVPRPPKTRFWVRKCVLLALKGILFAKLISVCPNQTFFVYFRSVLAEKKWIQSNLVHYLSVLYGDLVILVILGWNCRFYLYFASWLHRNGNFDESSVAWYTTDNHFRMLLYPILSREILSRSSILLKGEHHDFQLL